MSFFSCATGTSGLARAGQYLVRKAVGILKFCASQVLVLQNVVIQTNEVSKSATNDDCAYRINGICTTEDLGGVEISKVTVEGDNCGNFYYRLKFENYNDFTVSVIYEVESNDQTIKRMGTLVLKASETKTTECLYAPNSVKSIARKLRN